MTNIPIYIDNITTNRIDDDMTNSTMINENENEITEEIITNSSINLDNTTTNKTENDILNNTIINENASNSSIYIEDIIYNNITNNTIYNGNTTNEQ